MHFVNFPLRDPLRKSPSGSRRRGAVGARNECRALRQAESPPLPPAACFAARASLRGLEPIISARPPDLRSAARGSAASGRAPATTWAPLVDLLSPPPTSLSVESRRCCASISLDVVGGSLSEHPLGAREGDLFERHGRGASSTPSDAPSFGASSRPSAPPRRGRPCPRPRSSRERTSLPPMRSATKSAILAVPSPRRSHQPGLHPQDQNPRPPGLRDRPLEAASATRPCDSRAYPFPFTRLPFRPWVPVR